MKALYSIRPEFVKKLFSGEKRYEYRRTIFRKDIESIVVYSTKPEGMIVGELIIEKVINDTPESIWSSTKSYAGISQDFFQAYFGDKKEGYAIKIAKAILYDEPIDPIKQDKNFRAPQSFCYVE
jgi:predicted transcriptional regulator